MSPEQLGTADVAVLRAQLGLDQPLPVQYATTMSALVTGQLRSFRERRPVSELVGEALPPTVLLALLALALAVGLALPIALASAVRPYTPLDHGVTVFSLLGISLPSFWFALVLILVFTDRLRWLPASGFRPAGTVGLLAADAWCRTSSCRRWCCPCRSSPFSCGTRARRSSRPSARSTCWSRTPRA